MFFFHKDYFRNARGQHLKIFLYGVLLMLLAFLLFGVVSLIPFGGGMAFMFSDKIGLGVLSFIIGGLALIVLSILILMPLQYSIYAYYMYGYKGKDVRFKDGLILFKNGNFWKSIGIILLLTIAVMLFSSMVSGVVYGIGFMLASLLGFGSMMLDPNELDTLGIGASILFLIIQFTLSFIQLVFSLLAQIGVAMIMLNHIDQPQTSLGDKFAKGLTIAFKSFKDLLKLLFSNFILIIIPLVVLMIGLIITLITGLGIGFTPTDTFPMMAGVAISLVTVITTIVYIFIGYYMIGSFISYYFTGREAYEAKYERPKYDDYGPTDTQHITMS